nr:unnamed protein product [Callosobruchus analis]
MSRFSSGDVSTCTGPAEVKQGGGVTNHDSSMAVQEGREEVELDRVRAFGLRAERGEAALGAAGSSISSSSSPKSRLHSEPASELPSLSRSTITHSPSSYLINIRLTQTGKEWAKWFRMGQEFLEDDERPRRPVEVITEDKVALVEELVLSDRRLKLFKLKTTANEVENTKSLLQKHNCIQPRTGAE